MSDEPTLAEYHAASAAAVRRGERTAEEHMQFMKDIRASRTAAHGHAWRRDRGTADL